MKISVMITTRNRCVDLKRTLSVLRTMNPPADELLITADGCTDETLKLIEYEYPTAQILVNAVAKGSVASRDTMLRAATGDLVVSLDDDSYPMDSNFFGRLPALFAARPEVAVMYFAEEWDEGTISPAALINEGRGYYAPAFADCASVFQREIYSSSCGFPRFFQHMYEEPDYALQCYSLGYGVWVEPSIRIRHHFSSQNRSNIMRHQLHARNEVWTTFMRCPMPWLLVIVLFRVLRQFQYSISQGFSWVIREPCWWYRAVMGIPTCLSCRKAISWRIFRGWMQLSRRRIDSVKELESHFGLRLDEIRQNKTL